MSQEEMLRALMDLSETIGYLQSTTNSAFVNKELVFQIIEKLLSLRETIRIAYENV